MAVIRRSTEHRPTIDRNMSENEFGTGRVTVSLSPEEQWTLHHVLLERIDQESTADDPTDVDPPSVEVFQAFERLNTGDTTFTIDELEAIRSTLASFDGEANWGKFEHARIDSLQDHITQRLAAATEVGSRE